MVLKLWDVSPYLFFLFENDVNMYGTQAPAVPFTTAHVFENDVNMYGTQAACSSNLATCSLRMM